MHWQVPDILEWGRFIEMLHLIPLLETDTDNQGILRKVPLWNVDFDAKRMNTLCILYKNEKFNEQICAS